MQNLLSLKTQEDWEDIAPLFFGRILNTNAELLWHTMFAMGSSKVSKHNTNKSPDIAKTKESKRRPRINEKRLRQTMWLVEEE